MRGADRRPAQAQRLQRQAAADVDAECGLRQRRQCDSSAAWSSPAQAWAAGHDAGAAAGGMSAGASIDAEAAAVATTDGPSSTCRLASTALICLVIDPVKSSISCSTAASRDVSASSLAFSPRTARRAAPSRLARRTAASPPALSDEGQARCDRRRRRCGSPAPRRAPRRRPRRPRPRDAQALHGEGPFGRAAFLAERRVKPWGSSKTWPFRFQGLGKIDHAPHRRFPTESVLKTSRFSDLACSGERFGRICRGLPSTKFAAFGGGSPRLRQRRGGCDGGRTADRTCLAIVLAAGEGTRMASARPKVLHAVAGQIAARPCPRCGRPIGRHRDRRRHRSRAGRRRR